MSLIPGTLNEGTPFPEEPFIFPSIRHVGPPYISTLILLGLTIGLPMWFFSTPPFPNVSIVSNAPSVSNAHPPSQECPQECSPHIDPFPSSPIASSSFYSSSSCEILVSSN
jgi:hypothetical protein